MPFRQPDELRLRRLTARGRLAAQAVVLSLVVAATSAFAALHKTVTLDVDGSTSTVSAFGRTVADVLEAQGVTFSERDLVVPAASELIANEGEIVVRHGREVTVEIDGERREVWTTALTVGDVVAELGLRDGVRASASRSASVGRETLRFSTLKTVNVAVDGTTQEVATTALTVREALHEAGVVLGENDQVSVALDAAAVDGLVVMVSRVQDVPLSETTVQPYETVREDDPELTQGREIVEVAGQPGSRAVSFLSHQVGGVEIGRTVLAEAVLSEPVAEVIRVGTRVAPVAPAVANVEPGTARAIALEMVLARGWDEGQFACLDSLWTKESGWRVDAHNPSSGAHGIPQALPGNKMASAGADWQGDAATQITWGLGYIAGRYGTPCAAWSHSQARNWY